MNIVPKPLFLSNQGGFLRKSEGDRMVLEVRDNVRFEKSYRASPVNNRTLNARSSNTRPLNTRSKFYVRRPTIKKTLNEAVVQTESVVQTVDFLKKALQQQPVSLELILLQAMVLIPETFLNVLSSKNDDFLSSSQSWLLLPIVLAEMTLLYEFCQMAKASSPFDNVANALYLSISHEDQNVTNKQDALKSVQLSTSPQKGSYSVAKKTALYGLFNVLSLGVSFGLLSLDLDQRSKDNDTSDKTLLLLLEAVFLLRSYLSMYLFKQHQPHHVIHKGLDFLDVLQKKAGNMIDSPDQKILESFWDEAQDNEMIRDHSTVIVKNQGRRDKGIAGSMHDLNEKVRLPLTRQVTYLCSKLWDMVMLLSFNVRNEQR